MKILILNWRDIRHPLSGGAEISLFEHAKYWQKMHNEVIWFSSSFPHAKHEEVIDGIKIIRKGSHFTVHLWASVFFKKQLFGKPDIVVDSFHFLPYFSPFYIQKEKVIGLINEVAGKVWFENLFYPFALLGYYLEPRFFHLYNNIPFITGSDSAKSDLINVGISSDNISVIYHGTKFVIPKDSIKKEKKPTLIFVGRISADKGVKDALSAFVQVKKEIKNAQFWIIGKEERKGIIDSLLKADSIKIIKNDIQYFGFVSEEKKFELLKKAWLLVHPSKKEGWGLNVIEAGFVSTPTVGYDVEGLRDSIIHKKTGLLTRTNPTSLAQSIITLIKNNKQYKSLSKAAQERAKLFTWDKSSKASWKVVKKTYEEHN